MLGVICDSSDRLLVVEGQNFILKKHEYLM
jgi:hypothetical protein